MRGLYSLQWLVKFSEEQALQKTAKTERQRQRERHRERETERENLWCISLDLIRSALFLSQITAGSHQKI